MTRQNVCTGRRCSPTAKLLPFELTSRLNFREQRHFTDKTIHRHFFKTVHCPMTSLPLIALPQSFLEQDSSPTKFTHTVFEDSSPTELKGNIFVTFYF